MKSQKIICIVIFVIGFSADSCKTVEIILHGEISGSVSDAETSQPLSAASVKLNPLNDTTKTGIDGSYYFKNLVPGDYEIQASKQGYGTIKQNVTVIPAKMQTYDVRLSEVPSPVYSESYLDFGLDETTLTFTISNKGKGKFVYLLNPDKNWISVNPSSGEVTNETDSIRVNIDKTGLSENNVYKEIIKVVSDFGTDTINLYLNGVMDKRDLKYDRIVKIGTQVWMGQNLNAGTFILHNTIGIDNGSIEKYCYDNEESNCDIYGALYRWDEMMQYHAVDTGSIGTSQGVCPDGWHIPTRKEWLILSDYLGGELVAGGRLKETGNTHWVTPNFATNESDFSALPAGALSERSIGGFFLSLGSATALSISSSYDEITLKNASGSLLIGQIPSLDPQFKDIGRSVRCVRNPYKK
jgi:uncharacterized protein (TIGR02145 family)